MAKQSKRTRKFVQSGGVKARLEKGTINKKGKVKNNKKKGPKNDAQEGIDAIKEAKANNYAKGLARKREEADFVSQKNLGDLDMESFFSEFAGGVDPDEYDDAEEEAAADNSSDDDDKEDSDEDEEAEAEAEEKPTKKARKEAQQNHERSDSDSDSEEEDVEVLEKRMKSEMGKLESEDPEFHEFLQENDGSLLQYGQSAEGDSDSDEDHDMAAVEDDEEGDDDEEKSQPIDGNAMRLTPAALAKLEKGAFQHHGIKNLRKLVNAYKSACHLTDGSDSDMRGQRYHIESSKVFDRLMVVALTKVHEEFHYHLLGKGSTQKNQLPKKKGVKKSADEDAEDQEDEEMDPNKPINPKTLEKSQRWADAKPILMTFIKATLHILSEAKEPDLVVYVLKSLSNYMPYMTPFPRLAENFLKTLTGLWSAPIDASEDYQVVRLHAFLRIRQLALTQPFPFIEECLKKLYLAYAQRAKFANAASVTSALPTLTFMGNCLVELYSLDYHSSYQHAFVYIRQLALHLRSAMQKKTQEAMATVYCWQYLHCLKLWVAVLTEACQSDESGAGGSDDQLLRSLVFPLTQVILGTVSLIPSTRYLPLRLHCVRLLQQLAAASEQFIPTTSILLGCLDLKEIYQPSKKTTKGGVQPLALTLRLRADSPLRTMDELEMCISEIFLLLNREVDLYQYSPGFPEFSIRISQRLRKFAKESRSPRWKAYARGCLELCTKYHERGVNERAKLNDVAPRDVKQLELLRPIRVPSMGARYKESLEKEKRLEAASRPLQKTAKKVKEADVEDPDEKKSNKRKRSKKKKKAEAPKMSDVPKDALEQEDEVHEGIDWSDDEE
ncbi:unnamed protein product [Cylindrotheca closterium]|uniref:Nucleolar complex protein 2 homolog n=1 Tax=Cylindrotheca closterium TaxID=2856 RepID=A0AAD2CSG5_9STRA|nr:unnamed protein product [Cylindrotheca closterium]